MVKASDYLKAARAAIRSDRAWKESANRFCDRLYGRDDRVVYDAEGPDFTWMYPYTSGNERLPGYW